MSSISANQQSFADFHCAALRSLFAAHARPHCSPGAGSTTEGLLGEVGRHPDEAAPPREHEAVEERAEHRAERRADAHDAEVWRRRVEERTRPRGDTAAAARGIDRAHARAVLSGRGDGHRDTAYGSVLLPRSCRRIAHVMPLERVGANVERRPRGGRRGRGCSRGCRVRGQSQGEPDSQQTVFDVGIQTFTPSSDVGTLSEAPALSSASADACLTKFLDVLGVWA